MKLCLNRPAKQYLFLSLFLTAKIWKYKEVMKCVGGGDGGIKTTASNCMQFNDIINLY